MTLYDANLAENRESLPRLLAVPQAFATPAARWALHGSRPGHVAVASKTPAGWREKAYSVRELWEVLGFYAGADDVYLLTERFWGWRRTSTSTRPIPCASRNRWERWRSAGLGLGRAGSVMTEHPVFGGEERA